MTALANEQNFERNSFRQQSKVIAFKDDYLLEKS